MPTDAPMDFFVPVIDNYGDAGFAYSLAAELLARDPALRIRLVVSDPDLVGRMAGGSLPRGLSTVPLMDFFARERTISPSIATFFGYRLPADSYRQTGIRRELRFDYLQFDAGYHRHWGVASIHGTVFSEWTTEVTHFVPSWVPGGGGVVLPPLPHDFKTSAIGQLKLPGDILKILGGYLDRPWLSVFCYPDTSAIVARALQEVSEPHLVLWHAWPTTGPEDHHRHVRMPFLPLREYVGILGAADANIVRGENSLVASVAIGKPALWDVYRESNGAHSEKSEDYLRNLSDMAGGGEALTAYAASQSAFAGNSMPARQSGAEDFIRGKSAYVDFFGRVGQRVREAADIAPGVLRWIRQGNE